MASTDEIWIVDFGDPTPGEPALRRPALVIGPPESFGPTFPFVSVIPLTTTRRGLSLHVEIDSGDETGLREASLAQCELVRSVSRSRLIHRMGRVAPATGHAVRTVLRRFLDL
jgi:mRNA interferase MazF